MLAQRYRIFFFPRKSLPSLTHSISDEFVFFFFRWAGKKKNSSFFPNFGLVFFFSQKKFKVHSLTQKLGSEKKKKQLRKKKKNTFFTHSLEKPRKVVKNKLFRGKKKIRYLWGYGIKLGQHFSRICSGGFAAISY